jgi:hypothetical protein
MATATEPAWLAGAREAARATYESLPVPTNREEAWRFTNLRGFDPDAFDAHPGMLTIEGDVAGGVTFGSLAGTRKPGGLSRGRTHHQPTEPSI